MRSKFGPIGIIFPLKVNICPGGHSTFFSGRGVWPGFPKCGACELTFASEKLGACELEISKFGGSWAKIWVKIEAVRLKFPNFLKRGLVNGLFCLKWDPYERQKRREKGVFRAAHPYTPFLGQCPVPPGVFVWVQFQIPSSTSPTKPILSPTPFPMYSVSS